MMDRATSEETGAPAAAKGRARLEPPDLSERGGLKNGTRQRSDDRLFMQLLAFGDCRNVQAVVDHLSAASLTSVVYEDLNDPRGIAVLTLAQDPNQFVDVLRPLLRERTVRHARAQSPTTRCSGVPTPSATSPIFATR